MAEVIREDSEGLGLQAMIELQEATPTSVSAPATTETNNNSTGDQRPSSEHGDSHTDGSEYGDSFDSRDPEPGFAHIDGDIEGHGYNQTLVDIITVPCVGASPVDTWARDPLAEGYFGFPAPTELERYPTVKELPGSSVLSPTINRHLPKASHIWVRQGIRKEVSTARVMLYRHRELAEGTTLDSAADDLLREIMKMRTGLKKARPIFFICHSIGGLVVKNALIKASKTEELRSLIFDCHGVAFFGKMSFDTCSISSLATNIML